MFSDTEEKGCWSGQKCPKCPLSSQDKTFTGWSDMKGGWVWEWQKPRERRMRPVIVYVLPGIAILWLWLSTPVSGPDWADWAGRTHHTQYCSLAWAPASFSTADRRLSWSQHQAVIRNIEESQLYKLTGWQVNGKIGPIIKYISNHIWNHKSKKKNSSFVYLSLSWFKCEHTVSLYKSHIGWRSILYF